MEKALAKNQDSAFGYYLRGLIRYKKGNVQEGVQDLKRAHAIDPNNPDALLMLGYCYMFSGKTSAAKP